VVIPVRNRADVVGRAVASVLAQTFAGLEAVVVDDGSTDDSVAAARAVADARVRIVRQEAAGVDEARR
jgi:glycosyltransferase involved in cell wall biosynthesis